MDIQGAIFPLLIEPTLLSYPFTFEWLYIRVIELFYYPPLKFYLATRRTLVI